MSTINEFNWGGVSYRILLSREETGGAISVVDSSAPPEHGPGRHIHANEDETFVILSGRTRFWCEGETFERGPGESVFVPRGAEHTYWTVGEGPHRHLVILTPGGFENFFIEMARGNYVIPDDMAAVAPIAAANALTFTGPPLGAN